MVNGGWYAGNAALLAVWLAGHLRSCSADKCCGLTPAFLVAITELRYYPDANIRTFMQYGWLGVHHDDGDPPCLVLRTIPLSNE